MTRYACPKCNAILKQLGKTKWQKIASYKVFIERREREFKCPNGCVLDR